MIEVDSRPAEFRPHHTPPRIQADTESLLIDLSKKTDRVAEAKAAVLRAKETLANRQTERDAIVTELASRGAASIAPTLPIATADTEDDELEDDDEADDE